MEHMIFDGGFGTESVNRGYIENNDPLWSARLLVDGHEEIKKIHKSFLDAGADAVISNTYQASINGFQKYLNCTQEEALGYIRRGGQLAKESCNEFWTGYRRTCEDNDLEISDRSKPIPCASLGPYGACLGDGSEYNGYYVDSLDHKVLKSWHNSRLSILSEEDLELYMFETMPSLAEAEIVLSLTREYPQHKFTITFSCENDKQICHGESLNEAIVLANRYENVVGVGINCTCPEYITPLLKSISTLTTKNIIIMPNSGEIYKEDRWLPNETNGPLYSYVKEWINLGAQWIGGCCRTSPEDIRLLREAAKKYW